MPQQAHNDTYHLQRLYETPTSPHAYVNQEPPTKTSFDFNQSAIELVRRQKEQTHRSQ